MRGRQCILVFVCTTVALAGVRVARSQEATSATLPDQFQTGEMTQIQKPKKKKAESTSKIAATPAEQNNAPPVPEQTPAAEEMPAVTATEKSHPEPSPALEVKTNLTSARVTKSAPREEEPAPEIAPVEKKSRPKKRSRPAVQTEVTTVSAPVPMSLSVAQSMAISAPLPEHTYEMRRRNLTGSGICVVTVDSTTGTVTNATMSQSTGSPVLDKITTQTFKSWRFKPGTVSQVRVPISYE
jgi:TonB family protein